MTRSPSSRFSVLALALASAACLAGTASADFEADFDGLDADAGPGAPWLVDGSVAVTPLSADGHALRLRAEDNDSAATARRPIEMDASEKAWTASVDWRPSDWSKPGVVLEATAMNANTRLFRVTTISGKNRFRTSDLEADTLIGEDYKKNVWYRVSASGTLGEPDYRVKIVERGTDNAVDGAVVYDSAEGEAFRVNPAVAKPQLLGFGVWRGQGAAGYQVDVDNVSFTSGDAEPPVEPE